MIISLIVAMDEDGGISRNNQLPWHLLADLKRFKQLTMGHHIVMGRKTYETIGRPLPGRQMIVVTHRNDYAPSGCTVAHSLTAAIDIALEAGENELFIIGGGEIFNQAIDKADKIYLTTVHTIVKADVFFPKIYIDEWVITYAETISQDENNDYKSDFKILETRHDLQG